LSKNKKMYELAPRYPPMKNRYLAIFFAFFGGVLGLHRMYLKGVGSGSARLALFFVGLFLRMPLMIVVLATIGIVEGLLMTAMSPEEFDQKYNNNSPNKVTAGPAKQKPQRVSGSRYRRATKSMHTGLRKFRNHDLKGALEALQQADEWAPNRPDIHFHLACVYSLMEDSARGFYHLERAVGHGFRELEKIKSEDTLAYLRIQPEFPLFEANRYRMPGTEALGSGEGPNIFEALRLLQKQRLNGEITEEQFFVLKEKLMR
jgi:TM2 domain-containing membrane protein YozV